MLDDKPDQCDSSFSSYQETVGPNFSYLDPSQDSQLCYSFCLKTSFKERVNVLGRWLVMLLEARGSLDLLILVLFF